MVIKNKSSRPQDLTLKDRNLYYIVTILAGETKTISPTTIITNLEELTSQGKIAVLSEESTKKSIDSTVEDTISEKGESEESGSGSEELEEETPESDKSETDSLDSKFICEECNIEFASARGLASHMKRVHSNK